MSRTQPQPASEPTLQEDTHVRIIRITQSRLAGVVHYQFLIEDDQLRAVARSIEDEHGRRTLQPPESEGELPLAVRQRLVRALNTTWHDLAAEWGGRP